MAADVDSESLVNAIFKKSTQGILTHLHNMTPTYKGNPSCHYLEHIQVPKIKTLIKIKRKECLWQPFAMHEKSFSNSYPISYASLHLYTVHTNKLDLNNYCFSI